MNREPGGIDGPDAIDRMLEHGGRVIHRCCFCEETLEKDDYVVNVGYEPYFFRIEGLDSPYAHEYCADEMLKEAEALREEEERNYNNGLL